MWDDKLRKPHWGEDICFEQISGIIYVHVQDWA